jgi:hypothetical protein
MEKTSMVAFINSLCTEIKYTRRGGGGILVTILRCEETFIPPMSRRLWGTDKLHVGFLPQGICNVGTAI